MKTVAVLVPDFMIEHCRDFIRGVIEYFKNKDVKVYVANTQRNFDSPGMFEYQYWTSFEVLKSKQVDVYIIATGVYCTTISHDKMYEFIEQLGNVPIISDSVSINLPNVYNVLTDSNRAYIDIIKHLKEIHGCKKIAFMSANDTSAQEAKERFESFKNAMLQNKLDFDESLVFNGTFNDTPAREAILKAYSSRHEINFDAIVAANDLMATGCIRAFEELGVRVPDDVKVVGFDDAVFASLSTPRLSTINQNIVNKGSLCAEIAGRLIKGELVEKDTKTPLFPVFRQSCGCISLSNYELVYKDVRGNVFSEANMKGDLLRLYQKEVQEKYKYGSLVDVLNVTNTLRQLYFSMNLITQVTEITGIAVCLYKEPVYINRRLGFDLPEEVELYMYYNANSKNQAFRPGIFFNPKKQICPVERIEDSKLPEIICPIFSGEVNYGYLVCQVPSSNFYTYTFTLKLLISFIANAVEYTNKLMQTEKLSAENTKLLDNNTDLYLKTKTDELTGILNRRGFMEIGQRTIDLIQEMALAGIVFFADLDGLKTINDTYGHEMGDKAIKLQAESLTNVFRKTDVIGRLSGDEFAMVGNGMTIDMVDSIKEKINKENIKISERENLPFTLSVSVGAVNLEASSMLATLLTEADKVLYEEKRKKHAARK